MLSRFIPCSHARKMNGTYRYADNDVVLSSGTKMNLEAWGEQEHVDSGRHRQTHHLINILQSGVC